MTILSYTVSLLPNFSQSGRKVVQFKVSQQSNFDILKFCLTQKTSVRDSGEQLQSLGGLFPRASLYWVRLNFNILKLLYWLSSSSAFIILNYCWILLQWTTVHVWNLFHCVNVLSCLCYLTVTSIIQRTLWKISKRCWKTFSFHYLKRQLTPNLTLTFTSFSHRWWTFQKSSLLFFVLFLYLFSIEFR